MAAKRRTPKPAPPRARSKPAKRASNPAPAPAGRAAPAATPPEPSPRERPSSIPSASTGTWEDRPVLLGELSRMVAHEVRNALAVLYNVSTGLRRLVPSDGEDAQMLLGILEEELGRLERLSRDLVSLATPIPSVLATVSVQELLERAAAEVRKRCSERPEVAIRLETDAGVDVVTLDPARMQEAVAGLIHNAVEATGEQGEVRVHAAREKNLLRIDVFDRGPGLPPGAGERLFEPFYSTKASGMGLGLALCRRIVRTHGGDVRALPGPDGVGSCFRIEIPADCGG